MKFSVKREKLLETVSVLSRAVASKSAIPVLEGIFLKTEEGSISMMSYNLEIGLTKTIDASVEEFGEIVINARLLSDILRRMKGEEVIFTCDERMLCHIECGTAKFDIMGMAGADFPEMPVVSDGTKFVMTGEMLKRLVRQTAFAVSPIEGTRPILTGINVVIENGEISFVAIDGYRLAIRKEKMAGVDDVNFVVSAKSVNEVCRILDDETAAEIKIGKRNISFTFNGYVFISRLLDGDFVDYKKTIPSSAAQECVLNVPVVSDVLERISLIISDNFSTPVRCIWNKDNAIFSCATSIGRATDNFAVDLIGDEFEIGLNSRYLLEALKAAETDEVRVKFNGASAAVIVSPKDGSDDFTYMIMPMRLK